jgi:hypothetical protein
MASALRLWVIGERSEIMNDLKWFGLGAKLTSPSGDDITAMKVKQLKLRLRELDQIPDESDHA